LTNRPILVIMSEIMRRPEDQPQPRQHEAPGEVVGVHPQRRPSALRRLVPRRQFLQYSLVAAGTLAAREAAPPMYRVGARLVYDAREALGDILKSAGDGIKHPEGEKRP